MGEIIKPMTMLLYVINFAILFVVAWRFLYKPVTKFLDARAEKMRLAQEEIDRGNAQIAEEKKNQQSNYEAYLAKGEIEVNDRLSRADDDAKVIIEAARAEAEKIIESARAAAQEETAKAREALREDIASLSIQLSSRILEREVKAEDHEQLIDDFLEKVG